MSLDVPYFAMFRMAEAQCAQKEMLQKVISKLDDISSITKGHSVNIQEIKQWNRESTASVNEAMGDIQKYIDLKFEALHRKMDRDLDAIRQSIGTLSDVVERNSNDLTKCIESVGRRREQKTVEYHTKIRRTSVHSDSFRNSQVMALLLDDADSGNSEDIDLRRNQMKRRRKSVKKEKVKRISLFSSSSEESEGEQMMYCKATKRQRTCL